MTHWKQKSTTSLDVVYFEYQKKAAYAEANEVYIWDLDKTYLETSIDNFAGLMHSIFEKAFTKKNVPGTPDLLRSLARYRKKNFNEQDFFLFIQLIVIATSIL